MNTIAKLRELEAKATGGKWIPHGYPGMDSTEGTGIFRGDTKQLRSVLDALVQTSLWT